MRSEQAYVHNNQKQYTELFVQGETCLLHVCLSVCLRKTPHHNLLALNHALRSGHVSRADGHGGAHFLVRHWSRGLRVRDGRGNRCLPKLHRACALRVLDGARPLRVLHRARPLRVLDRAACGLPR